MAKTERRSAYQIRADALEALKARPNGRILRDYELVEIIGGSIREIRAAFRKAPDSPLYVMTIVWRGPNLTIQLNPNAMTETP